MDNLPSKLYVKSVLSHFHNSQNHNNHHVFGDQFPVSQQMLIHDTRAAGPHKMCKDAVLNILQTALCSSPNDALSWVYCILWIQSECTVVLIFILSFTPNIYVSVHVIVFSGMTF